MTARMVELKDSWSWVFNIIGRFSFIKHVEAKISGDSVNSTVISVDGTLLIPLTNFNKLPRSTTWKRYFSYLFSICCCWTLLLLLLSGAKLPKFETPRLAGQLIKDPAGQRMLLLCSLCWSDLSEDQNNKITSIIIKIFVSN